MTPMVAAVMEKFLAVEVGSLRCLATDVRSEERNMWKENWRGRRRLYAPGKGAIKSEPRHW